MNPILVAVAVLGVLVYGRSLLQAAYKALRVFWLTRTIPGPTSGVLCFLGPADELLGKAVRAHRQYGNTVRIAAFPAVCVLVAEPDDVEVVCNSPHLQNKPTVVYDSLVPILGTGLITLNGDTHRQHRKAIGPSLHFEILQDFIPSFERTALTLCEQWVPFANTGEGFNATPFLADYTASSICATVFSAEIAPEMEKIKAVYQNWLIRSGSVLYQRVMQPWYQSDFIFSFSSLSKDYYEAASATHSFVSSVLDYKLDQIQRGAVSKDRRRKAFLDHVLSSAEGQGLTRDDLIGELKAMSGAAIGTSTDLMSFFLLVLACRPDVQEKIVQELDDVFGGSNRPVEPNDLPHLQFMECCLKETMRFFPPVFTFSRTVNKDTTLPSGHFLPEGAIVATVPYFTHRLSKHFPEPDKFDPAHFLPESTRGRHPFAFIPFSAGARNCIGQRYAMISAKVLTSSILRSFRILRAPGGPETVYDIKLVAGIVSGPKDGAPIRLQKRDIAAQPVL